MITCTRCKSEKAPDQFYKDLRKRNGLASHCKSCVAERTIKYRKEHPESARQYDINNWLKGKYGLTRQMRYDILKSQEFLCAICQCELELVVQHIDHDRLTGQVRGILCSRCNQGFGLFAENIDYLRSAIKYKQKWSL